MNLIYFSNSFFCPPPHPLLFFVFHPPAETEARFSKSTRQTGQSITSAQTYQTWTMKRRKDNAEWGKRLEKEDDGYNCKPPKEAHTPTSWTFKFFLRCPNITRTYCKCLITRSQRSKKSGMLYWICLEILYEPNGRQGIRGGFSYYEEDHWGGWLQFMVM